MYIRHNLMPVLHYVLWLHFGKVCEQKREQKREKSTTVSRFYPMHSVIQKQIYCVFLALGNFLAIFLGFSRTLKKNPKCE